jgi:hypothetical protein
MGGWLDLTQQGLSPCKKYQALLGALTYRNSRRPPALDSSYLRRGDVVPEPSPDFPHLAPLREFWVIGWMRPREARVRQDVAPFNFSGEYSIMEYVHRFQVPKTLYLESLYYNYRLTHQYSLLQHEQSARY